MKVVNWKKQASSSSCPPFFQISMHHQSFSSQSSSAATKELPEGIEIIYGDVENFFDDFKDFDDANKEKGSKKKHVVLREKPSEKPLKDWQQIFIEDFEEGEEIPYQPLPPFVDENGKVPVDPELNDLADRICKLSSFEVAEVLKFMEARLEVRGIDISDNVIGFAGSGHGAGTAADGATTVEEVQEKVAFDIKLNGFDAKAKIKVIKEVRAITGLGLKEAKTLVEGVPNTVKTNMKKEEAEEMKERLEAVGASVDIE